MANQITCQICGFTKNPTGSKRCGSCGQSLEAGAEKMQKAREDAAERRYQQDGVSLTWMLIAFGVQAVLTGAIIFGLPVVIKALDFEGGNGMAMCVPVWAIGGTLIGMISPGRTFIEPFVASFLVALPVTWLLHAGQTVRTLPSFLYVILAGIGVLFTLIGAYIGERIQLGPPPKTAE